MYIKFIRTHVGDRDREETWDLFRQDIAKDLLRKLSPREQKILELRSGLKDGTKHTLRETAENFGITRERVRQIQNAALIKIRELMMMNGKKAIDIALLGDIEEKLHLPVNELELSVRTANCLRDAHIRTIGDLVIKTEMDMLKCRNFGKRCLDELNDILDKMGLHFGMLHDIETGDKHFKKSQYNKALIFYRMLRHKDDPTLYKMAICYDNQGEHEKALKYYEQAIYVYSYACKCGKYNGIKLEGIVCDRCGIEIPHRIFGSSLDKGEFKHAFERLEFFEKLIKQRHSISKH